MKIPTSIDFKMPGYPASAWTKQKEISAMIPPLSKPVNEIAQIAGNVPIPKAKLPTIGPHTFDNAKSALSFVKNFDPPNISGTIPGALNMLESLKKGSIADVTMSGALGGQIGGIFKQFANLDSSQMQSMFMKLTDEIKVVEQLSKTAQQTLNQVVQTVNQNDNT